MDTSGPVSTPGLIPARAGNTEQMLGIQFVMRAHPRSRGEHVKTQILRVFSLGSSPLARGTLELMGYESWPNGLIPARAGNTTAFFLPGASTRAHPRSRGEHQEPTPLKRSSTGSSPLARGTRCGGQAKVSRLGLIPARAGNTLADMGFYPLHQQNRITLKPEPTSRIHDN